MTGRSLAGRKILLGVTGSIAAYKTPELVRQLVKAGAEVRVVMTPAAADFVSPLSLSTVSKHPVLHAVSDGASWNNHVEMGLWADAMLIAPCSANTLARMASGVCDNLLLAVYLSARCPVHIAPAMDEDMWMHPATKSNLERMRTFGATILPVGHGELASGLTGEGRMAEPEAIVRHLSAAMHTAAHRPLAGTHALVSAGPTFERIDPVRFIGNFSTGKMGIALAEALHAAGSAVTLVLGPTHLRPASAGIAVELVESAEEMLEACRSAWARADIGVMAAAVADYAPAERAAQKIKKKEGELHLALRRNPDILATLGADRRAGQYLVGFALETEQEQEHALQKLHTKKADLIVLNSLRDAGAGFGTDTNKVTLLDKSGALKSLSLMSKADTATAIVAYISDNLPTPAPIS